MIKITTIFGEDAVREYEENNELPSEEWLADNGGVVDEKEFETEAEYNAYIAGVNDADGWSDYHIIRHRSEEADTSREENLWLRLGISVRGSREDIERILNGDTETLRKLLDAGQSLGDLYTYINTSKSLGIVSGILISVVVAFISGAVIQYLARLLFSFRFEGMYRRIGAIYGAFSITAIIYFLVMKGAKGASFMRAEWIDWINANTSPILITLFVGFTILFHFFLPHQRLQDHHSRGYFLTCFCLCRQ